MTVKVKSVVLSPPLYLGVTYGLFCAVKGPFSLSQNGIHSKKFSTDFTACFPLFSSMGQTRVLWWAWLSPSSLSFLSMRLARFIVCLVYPPRRTYFTLLRQKEIYHFLAWEHLYRHASSFVTIRGFVQECGNIFSFWLREKWFSTPCMGGAVVFFTLIIVCSHDIPCDRPVKSDKNQASRKTVGAD